MFDASATTSAGLSLNELQLPGPKLQPDIIDIIHDFRTGRVAFRADIKKMFRQVEVHPSQWNLQRIFWREKKHEPLLEYWLTVATYGMTSSAYNAVRALVQSANDHEDNHPAAAQIVRNRFYMDDMLACFDTEAEAIAAKKDVIQLLVKGGFELDKWISNCRTLMDKPPDESKVEIPLEDSPSVLGIKWDYITDDLMINVRLREQPKHLTKRDLASESARVFDPLLLLAPVTVRTKQFMKQIWNVKTGWDAKIPIELHNQWIDYYQSLGHLEALRIPRWIATTRTSRIQLHVFADASAAAYGACAYAVTIENDQEPQSRLLMAKSKLAPKEATTIPRMELCAAEMASALSVRLREREQLKSAELFLWTDSEIVLHWIHKESEQLKVFVGNKVAAIHRRTVVRDWRHVCSAQNPADLISRGMAADALVVSALWWHGPPFIQESPHSWPPHRRGG